MTEAEIGREIGRRLQQAMQEADMDRGELARLTGYTEQQIENWEAGRAVLYPGEIMTLCHTLDKLPQWLLGWGLRDWRRSRTSREPR
jgi:transcriptional regulator with XRE-family HTH domain